MNVSQRGAVSTGAYEAHIQRDVMVPMRDGVLLASDLHRPAQGGQPSDGPFPVLLLRTPYNKSTEARSLEARFFVSHGYIAVIQDCRGRYASGGGFSKYVAEGPDGYDTLEWLGRQPWWL